MICLCGAEEEELKKRRTFPAELSVSFLDKAFVAFSDLSVCELTFPVESPDCRQICTDPACLLLLLGLMLLCSRSFGQNVKVFGDI